MFESAELGQAVSEDEYEERVPVLRERLLEAQGALRSAPFPVIVLFAGVDGAGKGETTNLLSEWMDPHWIVTRAYGELTQAEREAPEYWRYWRDLPPAGQIGIFLSAWYSDPLVKRAYDEIGDPELDERLDQIEAFERTLVDDGALIVKFWMHLGRTQQEERLRSLGEDPAQAWRVTEKDWKHWRMYDQFIGVAERIIMRTSTGEAPWTIVEGTDPRFRSLKVATTLLEAMERRLADGSTNDDDPEARDVDSLRVESQTVLSHLDLSRSLSKDTYRKELEEQQARLNRLHRRALAERVATMLVFEGWDAAGKGGAIRRLLAALDARHYQVIMFGAPTDEERAHHYLWRFWRHVPRPGRFTIFDRSWYGRVLVERVEAFASGLEWRRAFAEINGFEQELVNHGIVLAKFWLHISKSEQKKRFKSREKTAYKRYKLTDEDWRNREKWEQYERAVHDMIERTSTRSAPWTLVEANYKRFARVKVLRTVCDRLEHVLDTSAEPKVASTA